MSNTFCVRNVIAPYEHVLRRILSELIPYDELNTYRLFYTFYVSVLNMLYSHQVHFPVGFGFKIKQLLKLMVNIWQLVILSNLNDISEPQF